MHAQFHRILGPLALVLAAGAAFGQPEAMPDNTFSYQGEVRLNGVPVSNEAVDFEFRLFDSAGGLNQVGLALAATAAAQDMVEGRFTFALNFGAGANIFDGQKRWLEIRVKRNGDPTFTTLPRQELLATPYAVSALRAQSATTATSAGNADTLDGMDSALFARLNAANAFGSATNSFGGSVGIGTSSPSDLFHLASGNGSFVKFTSANGDMAFNGGSDGVMNFLNQGAAGGRTQFSNAGGSALLTILNSNGNVGIGTATPGAPLDIAMGSKNFQVRLDSNLVPGINVPYTGGNAGILRVRNHVEVHPNDAATAAGYLDIRNTSGTPSISLDGANGQGVFTTTWATSMNIGGNLPQGIGMALINTDANGGNFALYTSGSGNQMTSRSVGFVLGNSIAPLFSVNESGFATVGTVGGTSLARLHLYGSESTSNGNGAAVRLTNSAAGGGSWHLRAGATGTGTPAGGLTIADNGFYRVTITSAGNVGIGQNLFAPQERLSIDDGMNLDQSDANNGTLARGLKFGSLSGEGIASKRTTTGNFRGLDLYTAGFARLSIANGGFVGVGRSTPVTGADAFSVNANAAAGAYGGMYLNGTDAASRPFYGYATGGIARAWTYVDGANGTWFVNNSGDRLSVSSTGRVGIGVSAPPRPLSFPDSTGDKISLWGQGVDHYGLGVAASQLRMYSPDATTAIVFGTGNSSDARFLEAMRIQDSRVSIGTTDLDQTFTVDGGATIDWSGYNNGTVANTLKFGNDSGEAIGSNRNGGLNPFGLDFYTGFARRAGITNGGTFRVFDPGNSDTVLVELRRADGSGGSDGGVYVRNGVGGNAVSIYSEPGTGKGRIYANGLVQVGALEILGGGDLAEKFDISGEGVKPGMVVSIDPDHPGKLLPCGAAYDRKVAGVVAGANGINPGLILKQEGSLVDGEHAVAMTGRVWCWADTTESAIAPGDRLTTSSVAGYAMRVEDESRAPGAVIGKAMTPLARGERGMVLVLVNLQ